jgi:SAM-dependent methyltransferase
MSVEANLREMERSREAYWLRFPSTSPVKLRWRARTVRHCFHVLPGESILEIGAGSGLWTEQLAAALRGENPITAAVFNRDFADQARARQLPNTTVLLVDRLDELPANRFDYIVGTAILCHSEYAANLAALHRLLKPGGQLLFFEANYWNPQVFIKNTIRPVGRWSGDAACQIGMRKFQLMKQASHQGFTHAEIVPYDIIHPLTPRALIRPLQSLAFIAEHAPVVRDLCGTLYIWLVKPGRAERPRVNLAVHPQLFGSVSVVVPCRNEEMNVGPLVDALVSAYDAYLHEIIVVDDNSTDDTAAVVEQLTARDPRVRLLRRTPPNGVGRALREGYAAATGRYVLTMDCDFALLVPELRDLFDAVAQGHDGAIGSRFSYESVLINYPFAKILCNRAFHWLVNITVLPRVRDISNNLKLYRTEILKTQTIDEPHFAANVETGIKPLLAGYDVVEVPVSWINRTVGMGASSFRLAAVAPGYARALMRIVARVRRLRGTRPLQRGSRAAPPGATASQAPVRTGVPEPVDGAR